MTPTEELIAHLKHFEGFVGHAYRCPAGYLTIGYGHRIDAPRSAITEAEATALLLEDIARFTLDARRLSPGIVDAAPRRLNAVLDFLFNCGPGAYGSSVLRLRVNEQRWEEAAVQNDRWVYITDPTTGQKVKSAWQVKRRAVTSGWLRTG